MTTFNDLPATCLNCGHHFTVTFSPSICTWLNPELIQQIYDRGYNAWCPRCRHLIPLAGSILIKAPTGVFMIDLGQGLESIREILEAAHLIHENGQVRTGVEQVQIMKDRTRRDADDSRYTYQGTMDYFG